MPRLLSRRTSLFCFGAVATFAVAGGEAVAAPSPAPVAQTYQDAGGTFRYQFDPASLPGATVTTQVGTPSFGGGCGFSAEGSGVAGKAGPTMTVSRELSFTPAGCKRELAVATYPVAAAPPAVLQRAATDNTVTAAAASAGKSGRSVTAHASASYSGYLKLNVEDPPQIDVTSTTAHVNWTAGATVTGSTHSANWGWYSPSGWQRTNASWTYGRNTTRAYSNVYGKYKNPVFCFTIDTWTEHQKTWFEGRGSGGWAWSYNIDKWGGCTGLLHYEHIVVHP